jgi:4-aminobutyrate aminotransferase-like enzyme
MLETLPARDELAEHLVPGPMTTYPVLVSGSGAEVTDEQGNKYLDLEAGPGVVAVGHCHPSVVEAIRTQAGRLMQGPGRYHSRLTSSLAERISELTGGRLKRVFFANSGAEANDAAIKIAFKHASTTGKRGYGVIAMEHGFHGRTSLPLTLTGNAGRKKGFGPYASFPGVVHVVAPYCYRCPLGLKYPSCGVKCAEVIEDAIKTRVPGEAAALIAEPIICVGGVLTPPPEYWPKVAAICRKHKILLIHDEVFSGWGRTGKTFAHQHWAVEPDIVTFAKAIGGGLPLGGFMATESVGTAFEEGDHFTTFGGNNQVGIAAGHAVLNVLKEERLNEKSARLGTYFVEALKRLMGRFPVIGDIRGLGLMIGLELVKDRATREPNPELASRLHRELRARRLLITTTGVHGCVLRITPPLVISQQQIDWAVATMEEAFTAVAKS